jgi:hypothetical protein
VTVYHWAERNIPEDLNLENTAVNHSVMLLEVVMFTDQLVVNVSSL